jgi:hypothetical protein
VPCHYWPLCARCRPASHHRPSCVCVCAASCYHRRHTRRLSADTTATHERRCRPRTALRAVALARPQALPLPRRQHSGDLSRRSSSLHGVSIFISIAPGSWPEKARPRPLPASLHQTPSEQRQRQELPRTAAPPKTRHNTTALYHPRTAAHCQALACVARTTLAAPSSLEHLRVRRP